jgi:capsular polysaccharide transport system permease protein
VNTTPQASQPTPRELVRREQRRNALRSVAIWVLGPTLLATVYYAVITPPQYETDTTFSIRGAQQAPTSLLAGLGLPAPTGATTDPRLVVNYLQSPSSIPLLKAQYGFSQAFSHFSLDPLAYLSPNSSIEWTTWFWNNHMKAAYDTTAGDVTVQVFAYSPQESLRLAQGVLASSKAVEDVLNKEVQQGSLNLAIAQVSSTKKDYDAATKKITALQGNVNTLTTGTEAAQAVALVGQIDAQLAILKVSQAAVQASFNPNAPQAKSLQAQIATLEGQRTSEMAKAKASPGPSQAEHDVEVQAALLDYQFAQKNYFAAESALVAAQPQNQNQSFVVAYIPPVMAEASDYWKRFLNVIAVALASALLLGAGSLAYSVIKDHLQ